MENQEENPQPPSSETTYKPVVPAVEQAKVMSVKDWVITLLIYAIPLVGFIMLFVWAFDSNSNPNLANWAKAVLIWMVIGLALTIFFLIIFGSIFWAAVNEFGMTLI